MALETDGFNSIRREAPLRLGIIGSSAGNGHPYSWAAICNGYDAALMADCPFPGIPAYLAARRFPDDRLREAIVTHIWTQDSSESRRIAGASRIATITAVPEDMIGAVDGLLLARDDAENHARFAVPFLRAGLPVYLDKPLALSIAAANQLLAEERYPGQIFTGTAVAWAEEMRLTPEQATRIGKVRHVIGVTPKYWDTYAVHVIEPALQLLGEETAPAEITATGGGTQRLVDAVWASGATAQFAALGSIAAPISLAVYGESGHDNLVFRDSFTAFRTALQQFCTGVLTRQRMFSQPRMMAVTAIIERGRATGG
ncbi:MAG: Gfo/Idh/MocA family oxidoreductase [Rhodospirillaceae bacterium]|nr:Gfo/Idh/MocA family oxidoreductase [Rhodospirillaceae bacterium]